MQRYWLVLVGLLSACGGPSDFLHADGAYVDGTPIEFREQLRRFPCDSSMAGMPPCMLLVAIRLRPDESEFLRGIGIRYVPSKMATGMPYESSPIDVVTVSAVEAKGDQFVFHAISGGQITFTSVATTRDEYTEGSFRDLVYRRTGGIGHEFEETEVLTLRTGSFRFQLF